MKRSVARRRASGWVTIAMAVCALTMVTPDATAANAEPTRPTAGRGKVKEHRESMRQQWRDRSEAERDVLRDLVRERREARRQGTFDDNEVSDKRGDRRRERTQALRELTPDEREQLRQDIREANRSLRRPRE